ncbi:MAG: cytochrome c-type biogenesis protein CcmH [Rhodobiaceae bacterium]|nr:cytochrome c-type biogenesis protein CcmH [Rhodobiaceae bacterium]
MRAPILAGLRRLALAAMLAVASLSAAVPDVLAVQPGEMLADPALEARAREISAKLRCLVCQNQTIDDSDAALARDLRILVRERLMAGDSDAEVIDFIVARYGEYVLLQPRLSRHTLVLWTAPAAFVLLGGMLALVLFRRNRTARSAPAPLDEAEKARLAALLKDDD